MEKEILTKKDIQELLAEQTAVVLDAVDEKTRKVEKKIDIIDFRIDKLIRTLDNFLKRMTDIEDEFTMMRNDINRIKKAIKEKLGVELS